MKEKIQTQSNFYNYVYSVFIILLPFVYFTNVLDPVLLPRQLFLTVFVCTIFLKLIAEISNGKSPGIHSASYNKVSFSFLILISASIISSIFAINQTESVYKVSKLLIEFSFFIITLHLLVNNKLDRSFIIKAIIVFSGTTAISSIWQIVTATFEGEDILSKASIITSLFANKNLLASISFLCLPFLFIEISKNGKLKIPALINAILLLFIILTIQTKAVILSITIATAILIAVSFYLKISLAKFRSIILLLLFFAAIASFFYIKTKFDITFFPNNNQHESNAVTQSTTLSLPHLTNTNSAMSRFLLWDNSMEMIKESPVLGVGPGNWQIWFPKYGISKLEEEAANGILTYQRPHNDFLWVWCETGLVGLAAYISVFLIMIFYSIKLLQANIKEHVKTESIFLLFGIAGYIFIAALDFPFERVEHQIILILLMAIISTNYHQQIGNKDKRPKFKFSKITSIILALAILLSIVVSINRIKGENKSRELYSNHHNGNWNKLIENADNTINTFYNLDPMSAPIEWYKGVALFTLGNTAQALQCFENAYDCHPYHIHVLNNLASSYEKTGQHEKAIEYYKKALEISPKFEESLLNISAVYFNTNRVKTALFYISQCNINSTDAKYLPFLTAILKSRSREISGSVTNNDLKHKINTLIDTPEKLIPIFQMAPDKFEKNLLIEAEKF